jgi:hypothetical protein
MASANRREPLLIQLDVLLDTRLGTIAQHWGDEVAFGVLETGYHARETDTFKGIDKDEFQARYKQRNVETLKHSRVTNAVTLLRQLVAVLTEQGLTTPFHDGPKILVNLFPYELSSDERDAIGTAVAAWIGIPTPIELVFLPPEDLTPSHCKQSYSLMMFYEYDHWLNIHTAGFKRSLLPEVTLLAPAIYFAGPVPAPEELKRIMSEAMHPLAAAEMLASPLIGLQLIDVEHFSVFSKLDSEPAYSPPQPTAPSQDGVVG